MLQERLGNALGTSVVVDNKGGGGGAVANVLCAPQVRALRARLRFQSAQ